MAQIKSFITFILAPYLEEKMKNIFVLDGFKFYKER